MAQVAVWAGNLQKSWRSFYSVEFTSDLYTNFIYSAGNVPDCVICSYIRSVKVVYDKATTNIKTKKPITGNYGLLRTENKLKSLLI